MASEARRRVQDISSSVIFMMYVYTLHSYLVWPEGGWGFAPPCAPPTPAEGYAIWTTVHNHRVSRWVRDGSPYLMALRRSRGGAGGGEAPPALWSQ